MLWEFRGAERPRADLALAKSNEFNFCNFFIYYCIQFNFFVGCCNSVFNYQFVSGWLFRRDHGKEWVKWPWRCCAMEGYVFNEGWYVKCISKKKKGCCFPFSHPFRCHDSENQSIECVVIFFDWIKQGLKHTRCIHSFFFSLQKYIHWYNEYI